MQQAHARGQESAAGHPDTESEWRVAPTSTTPSAPTTPEDGCARRCVRRRGCSTACVLWKRRFDGSVFAVSFSGSCHFCWDNETTAGPRSFLVTVQKDS